MPGDFSPPKPRSKGRGRHQRRRGILGGLAMEESWRHPRRWVKKLAVVDMAGVVLWGGAFVFILLGERCPSGSFSGWYVFFLLFSLSLSLVECVVLMDFLPLPGYRCNAYNVSSAAACFLCVAFGVSVFYDVKDLHVSKVSPRTKEFIDLISLCRTMDYILTNYPPIGFITVPFHSTSLRPVPTAQCSAVSQALVTA